MVSGRGDPCSVWLVEGGTNIERKVSDFRGLKLVGDHWCDYGGFSSGREKNYEGLIKLVPFLSGWTFNCRGHVAWWREQGVECRSGICTARRKCAMGI